MTIQELSVNATLGEVQSIPELREVAPYLLSWGTDGTMFYTAGGGERSKYLPGWPIRDMSGVGWNPESVLDGIRYLYETAKKGDYFYRLYPEEECKKEPLKAVVNITLFRSTQKTKKPCVIILPGGTYANVCSLTEGYPVAKAFNMLGYNAVILNYRTGKNALLPGPMEDLAAAVRYLQAHQEELNLYTQEYIVAGFSAGGHLCAEWGTENHGYIQYDCPAPAALFPIYPVISTTALAKP